MSETLRVEIAVKSGMNDPYSNSMKKEFSKIFGFPINSLKVIRVFWLEFSNPPPNIENAINEIFVDPIFDQVSIGNGLFSKFTSESHAFAIEKFFLPGVTDNVGKTAEDAFKLFFDIDSFDSKWIKIHSGIQILFPHGVKQDLAKEKLLGLASEGFYNPLIERCRIYDHSELSCSLPFQEALSGSIQYDDTKKGFEVFPTSLGVDGYQKLSDERCLSLSRNEISAILDFYQDPQLKGQRVKLGLPKDPTDVEVECLAQTWSEHCKHKIFAANIHYENSKDPSKNKTVNGLFKQTIQATTEELSKRKKNFLVSVFSDNSGVIRFDDENDVCFKVETHNSPSALDPYGGAMTGIVGVNRDILGTGLGARPIFNTDVFCFGPPDYKDEIPPGLKHPTRIMSGVIQGVEEGGNKSGIPTVNGGVIFDDCYLGKPLVYCGTGGIMPRTINGRDASGKYHEPGHLIIMVGGRIGKDGIHGATFSSAELDETSPLSAVQIGDPITQKRMVDFILEARDKGLISALTDNGAGGLSSSVGEMAEHTNGAKLDLKLAPLKYPGLSPWEILISESQERMTVALDESNLEKFLELSKSHGVESTVVGEFTDLGSFDVYYGRQCVASLPLEFLHDGCPTLEIQAKIENDSQTIKAKFSPYKGIGDSLNETLLKFLNHPNISTRESVIRRYDHEVQGQTLVRPLQGKKKNAPCDAALIRPLTNSKKGLVVSNGMNPWMSQFDSNLMAKISVDEALRNAVCVGGDPNQMAILDNFCWPDPIYHPEKNIDGPVKAAQLVETCTGLQEAALGYGLPLISGKDSMKNDYVYPKDHSRGGEKISVLPTLLVSLIGVVEQPEKFVTSSFKGRGNLLYLLNPSKLGLRGSHFERVCGTSDHFNLPEFNLKENLDTYQKLFQAIQKGWIKSAHDISDGGLLVTLSESAIGGEFGFEIDLSSLGNLEEASFSEGSGNIVIEVESSQKNSIESHFNSIQYLGTVSGDKLKALHQDNEVLSCSIIDAESAFTGGVFKWR